MKLCPHCSASLEDDAVKCRRCGKWLVQKREIVGSRKQGERAWKRLILLVGLGLLAWIVWAMPDGTLKTREILNLKPDRQAALRTMRGDLGKLVTLQDSHRENTGGFTANPGALGFLSSDRVTVSIIATPEGWSATARHEDHPSAIGCAVFGGSGIPPQSPVIPEEPGVVVCTGREP